METEKVKKTLNKNSFNSYICQNFLNNLYVREISPPFEFENVPSISEHISVLEIEEEWNKYEEDRCITDRVLPSDLSTFKIWYSDLFKEHRNEVSYFFEYLASEATLEEIAFYISLEEQVDGKFDDVIALAQLGMQGDMKLALAENYWDEMGEGSFEDMHTVLFEKSANFLSETLKDIDMKSIIPYQALKNGNILMMYSIRRKYTPRLLGALTILEHTAPYRFKKTVDGLKRFNVPRDIVYYHDLHIEVDANHGKQLLNRVLYKLIEKNPETIKEICIGCLIRFKIAVDYYKSIDTIMNKVFSK